jgi:hypothetical protein
MTPVTLPIAVGTNSTSIVAFTDPSLPGVIVKEPAVKAVVPVRILNAPLAGAVIVTGFCRKVPVMSNDWVKDVWPTITAPKSGSAVGVAVRTGCGTPEPFNATFTAGVRLVLVI